MYKLYDIGNPDSGATARQHYDSLLGEVYPWMTGDFATRVEQQTGFFEKHGIRSGTGELAFDLGAGHGIQSVALARLGFRVHAVDFNKQLLDSLRVASKNLLIECYEQTISGFLQSTTQQPDLVVCMGDTLTHFASHEELTLTLSDTCRMLRPNGTIILSFRELTQARTGNDRFFLVRADDNRSLTCFIEYFPGHVIVHDILTEKAGDEWLQRVSSYPKLRLAVSEVNSNLVSHGVSIVNVEEINGMSFIIGRKN